MNISAPRFVLLLSLGLLSAATALHAEEEKKPPAKPITHEAFVAELSKQFPLLDKDGSGKLDKKECARFAVWCQSADKDKDGSVDQKEFNERAEQDFKKADKNKDGALDPKEAKGLILFRF